MARVATTPRNFHDSIRDMFTSGSGATSTNSVAYTMETTAKSSEELLDMQKKHNNVALKIMQEQTKLLKKIANDNSASGPGGTGIGDLLKYKMLRKVFGKRMSVLLSFGVEEALLYSLSGIGKSVGRVMQAAIVRPTAKVFSTVAAAGRAIIKPLAGITNALTSSGVMKMVSSVAGSVKFLPKLLGKLMWPITAIMGLVDAFSGWNNAASILGKDSASFGDKVSAAIGTAINGVLLGIPDWIVGKLGGGNLSQLLANGKDYVVNGLKDFGNGIGKLVGYGVSNLMAMMPSAGALVGNAVAYVTEKVYGTFEGIKNAIWDGLTYLGTAIKDSLKAVFVDTWDAVKDWWNGDKKSAPSLRPSGVVASSNMGSAGASIGGMGGAAMSSPMPVNPTITPGAARASTLPPSLEPLPTSTGNAASTAGPSVSPTGSPGGYSLGAGSTEPLPEGKDFAQAAYERALSQGLPDPQARLVAAQAALESRHGKSGLNKQANNYFGVKAGKNWTGETATFKTREEDKNGNSYYVNAPFRKYSTPEESFKDHLATVQRNWPGAMTASTLDEAVEALNYGKKGGYATDQNYGTKIRSIANKLVAPTNKPQNAQPYNPAVSSAVSATGAPVTQSQARIAGIRKQEIQPELANNLSKGVMQVLGEGYSVEVYSGGQPEAGKGPRTGSRRHDDGNAADVYIRGPNGQNITDDEASRLAQYWVAKDIGSVGLRMRGGGIHLDSINSKRRRKGEGAIWNYDSTAYYPNELRQRALALGSKGVLPEMAFTDEQMAARERAGQSSAATLTEKGIMPGPGMGRLVKPKLGSAPTPVTGVSGATAYQSSLMGQDVLAGPKSFDDIVKNTSSRAPIDISGRSKSSVPSFDSLISAETRDYTAPIKNPQSVGPANNAGFTASNANGPVGSHSVMDIPPVDEWKMLLGNGSAAIA